MTDASPDACAEPWRIVTTIEYQEYITLKGQTITPVDPFDPVIGGAVFGLFFSSVVGLYILAKSSGLILEAIKRW